VNVAVPNREEWFAEVDGLPRPDWEAVGKWIESNIAKDAQTDAWDQAALLWLDRLRNRLRADYQIAESQNFLLLSASSARDATTAIRFLETMMARILKRLQGVAQDDPTKNIVVALSTMDEYDAYTAYFYEENDECRRSGGVFISSGYPHFVVWSPKLLTEAQPVLVHELTHNCLMHLPLPMWLNEGLTCAVEQTLMHSRRPLVDREVFEKHQAFWNTDTIQEFWKGTAFFRPDDGSTLSYNLAQVLVHKLQQDLALPGEKIREFILDANWDDAGEAAIRKHLEVSLSDLVASFIGPGDWTPKPETWETKQKGQ